jgi:hypothetical protein
MNFPRLTLTLLITALAAARSDGGTFNLPNKESLFSIAFPDNWETDAQGDSITSRPKNSAMVFSIFPTPAAKSLPDALAFVAKRAGQNYTDFSVGKGREETEAGMKFISAEAKGKQNGVEMRIFLYAFTPDGQAYFGICNASDDALAKAYGDDAYKIMDSLKPLKNLREKKEKEEAVTAVAYPNDKPAFTLEVPAALTVETTAAGMTIRKKGAKSYITFASIPPRDGVTDKATAEAWLKKKAEELLKVVGPSDGTSFSGPVEAHFFLMRDISLEAKYTADSSEDQLRIWVFTTGGQRYFYAYGRVDELREMAEGGGEVGSWWGDNLIKSIAMVK